MGERAAVLVDQFLAPLPWRRPKTGLLTPLVELLLDEVEFWDVRFDRDPRVCASLFVVFTPELVAGGPPALLRDLLRPALTCVAEPRTRTVRLHRVRLGTPTVG